MFSRLGIREVAQSRAIAVFAVVVTVNFAGTLWLVFHGHAQDSRIERVTRQEITAAHPSERQLVQAVLHALAVCHHDRVCARELAAAKRGQFISPPSRPAPTQPHASSQAPVVPLVGAPGSTGGGSPGRRRQGGSRVSTGPTPAPSRGTNPSPPSSPSPQPAPRPRPQPGLPLPHVCVGPLCT